MLTTGEKRERPADAQREAMRPSLLAFGPAPRAKLGRDPWVDASITITLILAVGLFVADRTARPDAGALASALSRSARVSGHAGGVPAAAPTFAPDARHGEALQPGTGASRLPGE